MEFQAGLVHAHVVAGLGATPDQRPTILLVEDDSALRNTCARLLSVWTPGATVVTAADGASALAQAAVHAPQLMLVDRGLPDVDGAELIRSLKKLHPGARSVLMTGGLTTADMAAELGQEIDGLLQKPFDVAELAALVEEALATFGAASSST